MKRLVRAGNLKVEISDLYTFGYPIFVHSIPKFIFDFLFIKNTIIGLINFGVFFFQI